MGLFFTMASRIVSKSPPVERSITVSAPKCTARCNLSSSPSMFEVVAELPMLLALILQLKLIPTIMGSNPCFK